MIPAPIKEQMYLAPGVMSNAWVHYFLNNSDAVNNLVSGSYTNSIVKVVSGSGQTMTTDTLITICDSAEDIIHFLPDAAAMKNRFTVIYNKGAGNVTVTPMGTATVSGDPAFKLLQYECIPVVSDGSNWFIF